MFLLGAIIIFLIILKPLTTHFGLAEEVVKKYKGKITLLLSMFLIGAFISTIVISIPAGNSGIVVNGPGIGNVFQQGLHFKNPLDNVETLLWSTQVAEYSSVKTMSSDSITLDMNIVIRYHIDRNKVDIVRIENPNYKKEINQVVRNIPKDVSSQYLALDIVSKERPNITSKIDKEVKKSLLNSHIIVESCSVQTISLPATYQASIEDTKVAEQRLEQAEFEKNVTIKDAEAQAMAIEILDNRMSQSSSEYLQWLYIKALTDPNSNVKWILPGNSDTNLFLPTEITGE